MISYILKTLKLNFKYDFPKIWNHKIHDCSFLLFFFISIFLYFSLSFVCLNKRMWTNTSAGRAFSSDYFYHFAPVLEPRHIRTRQKRLAFCLGSQPKQKLHILPRFCWEPRPYVLLCPSSPPEILGSHHGYTTTPSTTTRSETQNERSVATAVFSFIVRAIFESCNHHGTSMFFIHKNVNITLA